MEVHFAATVTSRPHFFFGRHSRAEHETFRVRSDRGQSFEVVDNVDVAPRIAVAPGDRVVVQGDLVNNPRYGPVVHWTHHDPHGRHVAGFIEWNGRRYA